MKNNKHLMNRTDFSNFIVHLTRHTEDGKTAKDNLISIINTMRIKARNHHCLFSKLLLNEAQNVQEKFYVSCFTEAPIDKLREFFEIANRRKNFQPYGVIFFKDISNFNHESLPLNQHEHPNPVLYVTHLNRNLIDTLKLQYDSWLNTYKESGIDSGFYLFGALVNYVGDKHDFSWEREWRVVGDYGFITPDVVAVIAPENEHDDIRQNIEYFSEAITLIDANWTFEETLLRVSAFAWNNWYKYTQTLDELNQYKNIT